MNEFRTNSVDLFLDIFENDSRMCQFPTDTLRWISHEIEKGCHSANIDKAINKNVPRYWEDQQFQEQYSSIVYRVSMNIDPESSVNKTQPADKKRFLISKIHSVAMLVWLLEYDLMYGSLNSVDHRQNTWITLNDSTYVNIIELRKIGYMNNYDLNPHINASYKQQIKLRSEQYVEEKTNKMYPCPQCKVRDARCRQIQTRSGDEGYTLFLTCKGCGFCWRIYG